MFPSEERHGQWLGGAGELIPAASAAPQGDRFRREASRGQRQAGKWEDPEGLEVQAKEWGAFSGPASQQESMVRCGGLIASSFSSL